VKTI
jgi:ribonuclease HI